MTDFRFSGCCKPQRCNNMGGGSNCCRSPGGNFACPPCRRCPGNNVSSTPCRSGAFSSCVSWCDIERLLLWKLGLMRCQDGRFCSGWQKRAGACCSRFSER